MTRSVSNYSSVVLEMAQVVITKIINLISRLVAEGRSFENWLQIEIYNHIISCPDLEISLEYPIPGAGRVDFWENERGSEALIELNVILTNYRKDYTEYSGRGVTDSVSSTVRDLKRLVDLSQTYQKSLLLLHAPKAETPTGVSNWEKKVELLKATGAKPNESLNLCLNSKGKRCTLGIQEFSLNM